MNFTTDIRNIPKIPVSLITTLYNEEKSVVEFLRSLTEMTRLPDDIVIVDGGSKDGTLKYLEEFRVRYGSEIQITVIVDETCTIYHTPGPIAKGRNVAIRNAKNAIIAVTDAGCVVDKRWLEEISAPFLKNEGVQLVAGWYEPLTRTYFEECQALATFQNIASVDPHSFLPSSRSVAFTRAIWDAIGGYPELALGGEDTLFDLRIKAKTDHIVFCPTAIVYWRLRPTFRVFVKLVYRYGFGDGFSRILFRNLVKNMIKILIAVALIALASLHSTVWWTLFVLYVWLLPFNGHLRGAFHLKDIMKYPTISFLKLVATTSYMIGFVKGMMTVHHPTFEKVDDHQH